MQQTPFHAYYTARVLESAIQNSDFAPVFASSKIEIYPFQVAAASFALHSKEKGAVLCDEAGMGKSHEAMLVMVQKWLEGCHRILLCIPNADLLNQWIDLLNTYYTVPYVSMVNNSDWIQNGKTFEQDGVVITTYSFAAEYALEASAVKWDLTVFEEANDLSSVYQSGNKLAKLLKAIAGDAFKLLLTGTPIEKNIMDLYGLIWFIDESVLPDEQDFLKRYLRKPENYPELASKVSKFCFRTLRAQAKSYAKIPNRVLFTYEYTTTPNEQDLYKRLYDYINSPNKIAFPEMDSYDLALRLLSLQSSSTAAILQTVNGIIKRLQKVSGSEEEQKEWQEIKRICESITVDSKQNALIKVLDTVFKSSKSIGIAKKAVVFTESVETQKMLYAALSKRYHTIIYNGTSSYDAIREFTEKAQVLISTDNGAKGFNLQDASVVIHYDIPYNTLKMEQRIDRCHRLGQENDVLSVAFIDKNNFSDVRKLELVNKRVLVSDGVFGISDQLLGGFSESLADGLGISLSNLRNKQQIENDYQNTLLSKEETNKQTLSSAEDMLFTTFTKELADKVRLSPQYIREQAESLNNDLWNVVKYYFELYNSKYDDCIYMIDDTEKTVTASNYENLPVLFYYWDGSRNKRYTSMKAYGMSPDFKPHYGRITLSSIIGRGVLSEIECSDEGKIQLKTCNASCQIALYHVSILNKQTVLQEKPVLIGQTEDNELLTSDNCAEILTKDVLSFSCSEHHSPHWLKTSSKPHQMDRLLDLSSFVEEYQKSFTGETAEVIRQLKAETKQKKNDLTKEIDSIKEHIIQLGIERDSIMDDRIKRLAMDKQINLLRQQALKQEENLFFDAMRLDVELEDKIKEATESNKIMAKAVREFIVEVNTI